MRGFVLAALAGCGRLGFGGEISPPDQPDAGAMGSGNTPTAVGLVAYWTMDGFVGSTTIEDASGTGNDATCAAGQCPSVVAGVVGQAASFDGEYSCLTATAMAGWMVPQFTVSAWIQAPTMLGPVLVHESDSGCPSPELSVQNGLGLTQLNTSDSSHNIAFTPTAIASPSAWHHIAATWDGVTQQLYVDGQCSCNVRPTLLPLNNSQPFTIGCYPTGGDAHFTGLIDEVRVYNRVLALDEIAGLYAVGGRTAPAVVPCDATCLGGPPS